MAQNELPTSNPQPNKLTILLTIEQQEIKRFEIADKFFADISGKTKEENFRRREELIKQLISAMKAKYHNLCKAPGLQVWISFESKMNKQVYDKTK